MKGFYLTDRHAKRRWETAFFLAIVLGVVVTIGAVLAGVALGVNTFAFVAAIPLGALTTGFLVVLLDSVGDREYRAAVQVAERADSQVPRVR